MATRSCEFKSTNIKSAIWTDGVLEVTFNNGSKFRYGNVTADQFDDFSKSESAGRWLNQNVKSKPKEHPVLEKIPPSVAAAASSPSSGQITPTGATPDAVMMPTILKVDPIETAAAIDTPTKVDENQCAPRLRVVAQATYEAYIKNSDGLNFRGEPCPPWIELTTEVRSHWCAAVMAAARLAHPDAAETISRLTEEHAALRTENEALVATAKTLTAQVSSGSSTERVRALRPWRLRQGLEP